MKHNVYFFIFLFFSISSGITQPINLADSIQEKIKSLSEKDKAVFLYEKGAGLVQSKPYEAQKYLTASLQLFRQQSQVAGQIQALNDLASTYLQIENNAQGLEILLEAEKLISQSKADSFLVDTYTILGIVYERLNQFESAIQYYEKVKALLQQQKAGPMELARNLTNIAHAYAGSGNRRKAIQIYKEALRICEEHNIYFGIGLLNQNLADEFVQSGLYPLALQHAEKAIQVAKEKDFPRIEVGALENKAAALIQMKSFKEALQVFQTALSIAKEINYTKSVVNIHGSISTCYEALGNTSEALRYFKLYTSLNDSVYSREQNQRLQDLQIAFETEQKEAKLRELQQANDLQEAKSQRRLIFFGGLFLTALLATGLVWMQSKRKEANYKAASLQKALQEAEEKRVLQQQKNESELNALKAQMNPHFIFNALNSIQEMFLLGDKMLANEHLARFSDLTRAILDSSGKREIRLEEELAILQDYLSIEQLRFEEDMEYHFQVDSNVQVANIAVPPMLIQPYVENAIKHGLLHKKGKKILTIGIEQVDAHLKVIITDNGIGRKQAAYFASLRPKKHTSFSSSATEKRLALLNDGRDQKIGVTFEDVDPSKEGETGTKVTLIIPIQSN